VRRLAPWLLAATLLGLWPSPTHAQSVEEARLLRDAAARESQGDLDGAEEVLRRLLQVDPASSGGLFALERVLRARGATARLLPAVDTFLAHDPTASGVRYLKLRVLVDIDSTEALEPEAERWFRAEPGTESPYREVSRVFEKAFGPQKALDVLRRGREALGKPDALALETGDLLATTGQVDDALKEWTRAVGDDGAQAAAVATRVAALPGAAKDPGRSVVSALGRAPEVGRRTAAVQIAVSLGLEAEALDLSRRLEKGMDEGARMGFLSDVGRRARGAGLSTLAAWAYGELGQDARSPGERRQFDRGLVESSLARGDTAAALEAQRRVVDSFTPGSADRRQATALAIRLEAPTAKPERLRALLGAFRGEFPDAPELDDVAASAARALLARGDTAGARAVLEGSEGAHSAVERGYLRLAAGDVTGGRASLLAAVGTLEPADATGIIQLAGLLGRLSPGGASLLTQAAVRAHAGRGGEGADLLAAGADSLPETDRAPVLAEASRMADAVGADEAAARLRARILADHPDAPEAAEASLALARYRARTPAGRDEAIRILEDLVTRLPNAAVVPDARRELERLKGRGER
jgi:tetratricopeptide (TPR) repeat protein